MMNSQYSEENEEKGLNSKGSISKNPLSIFFSVAKNPEIIKEMRKSGISVIYSEKITFKPDGSSEEDRKIVFVPNTEAKEDAATIIEFGGKK